MSVWLERTEEVQADNNQARSRAQGSIGVPPVFRLACRTMIKSLQGELSHRSPSSICSRHSATQARRLCYHRLGVMPPLRPVGESSLLEMSKPQSRHFVPGYYHAVPPGQNTFTPPPTTMLRPFLPPTVAIANED